MIPKRSKFRAIGDFFRDGSPSQSLISLPPDEVISKHFQAGLKKLGLAWTVAIEVSSLELIDLYTSLGFGAGLSVAVPRMKRKNRLCAVPLSKFPPLTIAALWIGELSEPAATFLADVRTFAGQMNR